MLTIATYVALLLAVIGLWFGRAVWGSLLIVAIVLGYVSQTLYGPAVVWIAALALACWGYARTGAATSPRPTVLRAASTLGILAMASLLALHVLPGFRSFEVAHQVVLSPGAAPYTFDLNFDKAIVGVLILGLVYRSLLRERSQWLAAFKRAAPIILINVTLIAVAAVSMGYSNWQPHWTPLFWVWATSNLFSTCLAEEGLFRAFILRELRTVLGAPSAIAVSAILFGLAHAAGGISYVVLAAVAGVGYSLAFHRSNSVEMSMLAHLALNSMHFLLFTYPYAIK